MSKKKFLIIDANSLIHRAFHALPPLTTKDGQLVNAVYGFTTIFLKTLKELKPDYVACCFDVSKDTFRRQAYEAYKAQRVEQPSELYSQINLIKLLLEAFKIPIYEKMGYEADDIIGTLVTKCHPDAPILSERKDPEVKGKDNELTSTKEQRGSSPDFRHSALSSWPKGRGQNDILAIIVSGDLDTLQLVDENTEVYTLKKGVSETVIYDEKAVKERFGFGPEKMVDYKALRGDPSDNIPGVKGIGEKTAATLIQEFGSLEKIYQKAQEISEHKSVTPTFSPADEAGRSDRIKESVLKKLLEHKKEAFLSQKLATIVRNVEIDFNLDDCQVQTFDTAQVIKLFQAWNFTSLIGKIPQAEKIMYEKQGTMFEKQENKNTRIQEKGKKNVTPTFPPEQPPARQGHSGGKSFGRAGRSDKDVTQAFRPDMKKGYHLINDKKSFDDFIKKLKQQKEFALDTETDGLNPFKNNLIGMSFSWQKGEAWYMPVTLFCHPERPRPRKCGGGGAKDPEIKENDEKMTPTKEQWGPSPLGKLGVQDDIIKKILENKEIKKIGHNLKFDLEVLNKAGIKPQCLAFDTMLASYLLNPGSRQHNLDALAFTELGYKTQPITSLFAKKEKIDLSKIDVVQVANYACEDADVTWQLYHKLSEKLDDALITGVLEKIEMPLIPVLAEMEKNGLELDIKFLRQMSKELELGLKNLELRIYKIAGATFNVASPQQLKEILFDKLKISAVGLGKTKTGISTAAGELEKLKGRHPIIDFIMEHRELSKLKNTYLDPLPDLVDENDRVHTSFNQTVTATGRLSSSEPNLQNIPVRTELGQKIRQAFIAENGFQILAADYSQIELRIVASLANDEKMLEAFRQGQDIHTRTAAEIFEVEPEKVTKEMRRQAKAVNFGIIYGLGPRGLAQGTGLSYEEAQIFIEKYFDIHSGIKEYIENTIALAHEMGYVETLFGRRRYLPEIKAQHQQLRSQAERMAINHPVQGTAADLIKLAMINIDKKIKSDFAPGEVKMLLQVHDELVFEVKNDLIEPAKKIIKEEMENVYQLKAPIVAEVAVGKNWGEC